MLPAPLTVYRGHVVATHGGNMMKTKLTKTACAAAEYTGAGWSIHWDTELPGFGLRVFPGGTKTFVVRYRPWEGRSRLFTLGRLGVLTVKEARERAREVLGKVARGDDPQATKLSTRRAVTVDALADAYLELYCARKKSGGDDERRLRTLVRPAWGRHKAISITHADAAQLHRRIGQKSPVTANRVASLLRHMFTWAAREGFVPPGHPNPVLGLKHFREKSRDRWLSHDEVRRIGVAIKAEPNPYLRALWQCLLYTGCRKGELLELRWEHLDLVERKVIRIPETKSGGWHHVPLAEPALEILRALPRQHRNPFVFCGAKRGSHLTAVNRAWGRVTQAAGVEDATIHDLRRTVGSWIAQSGESLPMIGAVLGHSNPKTTQVYARLADEGRRRVLERHGQAISAALSGDDS